MNKKGFISIEAIILLFLLLAIGSIALACLMPQQKMIDTVQYEGLILSKHDDSNGKYVDYFIKVEGINHEILFNVPYKNYNALEPGYHIKYFSYKNEGKDKVMYELGTPESKGTIILLTNNSVQTKEKEGSK